MKDFLRVLKVAVPHAWWLGVAVISMFLVASSTVFAYNLIRPIYNELLSKSAPMATVQRAHAEEGGLVGRLDRVAAKVQSKIRAAAGGDRGAILLMVIAAILVKNIFTFLSRYSVAQLGLATIRDLRDKLFDALLAQNPRFFQENQTGTLVSRVVNDVLLIHQALSERFGDLLQDSLTVVVLLAYAFSLNARLALATVVLGPILVAPMVYFSRRLRRRSRQSQERMGDIATILHETIGGIRVVQAFGMEDFLARRFHRATQRQFWANLKARAIQAANAPVMEVMGACGFIALIGYASLQIHKGTMTLGDFSAFLIAMYGTYNPIKRLNQFNLALQQAIVASGRVYKVIDAPVQIKDRPGARVLDRVDQGIHLDHVWFAYEADEWILKDVDLEIPLGKTVAIVGHSGAGKSTVAQLIPRFWDVQRGAVRVSGFDVRDLTLRSLRSVIGLVTQETILFNDTIRANVAFGRDDAPQEDVEAAARAAYAHDFISNLPGGYDTVIGESGVKLSGGERQRLAIARALLKDPPILILDEATSSLDTEAERLVQRALENLMEGRTTLVIAHRLTTVRNADAIAVLEDGRIVERGSHRELLDAGGAYARMVSSQEFDGGKGSG